MNRKYQIELEQETDGRWIAEIEALPGATLQAKVYNRSVEGQINYWAKIGKIAEENPDLSFEFIKATLRAREEALAGQVEPYLFS